MDALDEGLGAVSASATRLPSWKNVMLALQKHIGTSQNRMN